MSFRSRWDAERQAERDFELRGRPDRDHYSNSWSHEDRAYKETYDRLQYEQERRERFEREQEEERQHQQQQEKVRQIEEERRQAEEDLRAQQEAQEQQEDPEPVVEAIQHALYEEDLRQEAMRVFYESEREKQSRNS